MDIDRKHDSRFKTLHFSRSSPTDALESRSSDAITTHGGSPTAIVIEKFAKLPMEIIYCMLEVMRPCATIGFALTNKPNLSIYTQWLDTASSLQTPGSGPGTYDMLDFLRIRNLRNSDSGTRTRCCCSCLETLAVKSPTQSLANQEMECLQ